MDNLSQVGDGLLLGEPLFVGDEFGEVASFAEFGDDVGVVFGGEDVEELNDVVGIFEGF
jgi:hypothetical protein